MLYEINDESLDSFPATLAMARNHGKYSQAEAAKAIGVTPQTILKWEKGVRRIQKSKRAAAAQFIASTGLIAFERGDNPTDEIKEAFIHRIAAGPALSDREVAAASMVGVHHEYRVVIDAFTERFINGPHMSAGEIDLLVETVKSDASKSA